MLDIMGNMDIGFPNLGLYLKDLPSGFSVFGFWIAFYGICIAIGVMAGILMAARMAKVTGQNPEIYWDFAIYAIIFSVIGARLYYVAFEWDYYKNDLMQIFNTRNGGLAIYGAVIGAFLTGFVYCKIKKLNPLQIIDTGVYGLILGQAIGRWGNFFNREVFGGYTDGLFAMRIPVSAVRDRSDITADIAAHMSESTNYIQVHPTFLYESVWNLLVLGAMLLYRKRQKFHGEIMLLYLGGYGLGRFIIEGIRTDRLLIPGTDIAVSQLLALICFVGAIIADVVVRIVLKKKGINPMTTNFPEKVEESGAESTEKEENATENTEEVEETLSIDENDESK